MTIRLLMRIVLYATGAAMSLSGDLISAAIFIVGGTICEHLERRGA